MISSPLPLQHQRASSGSHCQPLHIYSRAGGARLVLETGIQPLERQKLVYSFSYLFLSFCHFMRFFPWMLKLLQWSWRHERMRLLQWIHTGLLAASTSCVLSKALRKHLACITWLLTNQNSSGPERVAKSRVSITTGSSSGFVSLTFPQADWALLQDYAMHFSKLSNTVITPS